DPAAIDPKALNALPSAKPAEAQSPIITIAAGPETSATPVAPVPSAAVVLQARQPVAVDATTEAATPVSTIDTTEAEADTAAPVIAGPAHSEARTEAENEEIDATLTTVAFDCDAHQPITVTVCAS